MLSDDEHVEHTEHVKMVLMSNMMSLVIGKPCAIVSAECCKHDNEHHKHASISVVSV